MVAKVNILKRLLDAINYNEKKVEKGKADCIYAGNYLHRADEMNFYQKWERLKNLDELNSRASTKTLHISLNFDPSEKLEKNRLCEIASVYMEKIGFGEQPFLVYHHFDAGHPHIHIVSTAIQDDGRRISTHNIGKDRSEKARKEIEDSFGLVKASSKKPKHPPILHIDPTKISYGKTETKSTLSSVVNSVFTHYAFTSLAEFNAALRQFNVVADRGTTKSRTCKSGGLLYRIIDETGNKIGVPVKASLLFGKPTLINLEVKFEKNRALRDKSIAQIKETIDECLLKKPGSIQQLIEALNIRQVYSLLRQSADGRSYGITFVDNRSKCVFNGSDIGKGYSIAGLQQSISKSHAAINSSSEQQRERELKHIPAHSPAEKSLLQELMDPKPQIERLPSDLKRRKKKKKRNNND